MGTKWMVTLLPALRSSIAASTSTSTVEKITVTLAQEIVANIVGKEVREGGSTISATLYFSPLSSADRRGG